MKTESSFQLHEFSRRAELLLELLRAAFAGSSLKEVRDLGGDLPAHAMERGDKHAPFTLAFVGQYNAGKSSLLAALTGRKDIVIDSNVATKQLATYPWNGLNLVDTPGVMAGFKEHDALAAKQIAKSDLLVFVTTGELFVEGLSDYFRMLAFAEKRAAEMVLVVNKMDRDDASPEIKRGDLEAVTAPLTIEDFRTVFMSVESYNEALGESDESEQLRLMGKSHMPEFIEALNAFVRERGELGRLTSPLYTIHALAGQGAAYCSLDQPEERAVLELLGRRSRLLRESRSRLEAKVMAMLGEALADLARISSAAAGAIQPGKKEKELNEAIADKRREAVKRTEQLREAFTKAMDAEQSALKQELKALDESPIARKLHAALDETLRQARRTDGGVPLESAGGQTAEDASVTARLTQVANILKRISDTTIGATTGPRAASGAVSGWSVSGAAGSQAHKIIYTAGKFFGKSFKPWEATRIASNLGKVARILGPLAAALGVVGQIFEDRMENEQRLELQKARQETYARFWDSANAVRDEFTRHLDSYLDDFYGQLLTENDQRLTELEGDRGQRSDASKELREVAGRSLALIEEINHAEGIVERIS